MSVYPANNTSNVFNADDFLSPDEITYQESSASGIDESELNDYVKKSGSVMTGALQLPQIILNGTTQTTAYSTSEKTKLDTNTSKLENITKTATHTEISDLKCDAIQFPLAIQNQAFTDADKTQIYINQGNLDGINNTVNDIVYENKTLNIKDCPVIDVVNTQSSNTKFDGALSFLRTGSVYRKWWIGTIGDNLNPQNTFNICVNGNHTEPESVLQLDHNGKLTIKNSIILNEEEQNFAFTDQNKLDLSLVKYWVDRCAFNQYDTHFYLPVVFDSKTSLGEITINNQSIKYNDNTEQTTAFTTEHANVLDLISIEAVNNRIRLKSTNNGLDKIEVDSEALYLRRGGVLYGEIGALDANNTLYINGYNNKDIIINPAYSDLIVKSNNVKFENDFGDNKSNLFVDNITTEKIIINNENQTKAYTDVDYNKLNSLILPANKILVKCDLGWDILNRGKFNYDEYIPETVTAYNIMGHTSLSSYSLNNKWNAGNKRIRIKYSINFKSEKSKIWYFKSKIIQQRTNNGVFGTEDNSLFAGEHNHIEKALDFYEFINYGDDLVVDVKNDDSLYIYTEYKVDCALVHSLDLEAQIRIEEI